MTFHSGETWTPASWRQYPAQQLPVYEDESALGKIEQTLSRSPPLVKPAEIRQLRQQLAAVCEGEAMILQGGDCAETLEAPDLLRLRGTVQTLRHTAGLISLAMSQQVVTVGRVAGQFAKPRSQSVETRDGVSLPSYRGDIINSRSFTAADRRADPARMLQAYEHAASTMDLIAHLTSDGGPEIERMLFDIRASSSHLMNNPHVDTGMRRVRTTSRFIETIGPDSTRNDMLLAQPFYTSHEALLLPYEQHLTRQDPLDGKWYNCSAHTIWLGDRTRETDGAHVAYASGIENPIGIKCGPGLSLDGLRRLVDIINPSNIPGRVILIIRMGARKVGMSLPPLVRALASDGRAIAWMTDPMHGNTQTLGNRKTRDFRHVSAEVRSFVEVLQAEALHVGGMHLEVAGQDVTECIGGTDGVTEERLDDRYWTACDPRLNPRQTIELAFEFIHALQRADDRGPTPRPWPWPMHHRIQQQAGRVVKPLI